MEKFIVIAIPGLFTGAAYAITASGLVLTYTTTRVFNFAHGALGMVFAFTFWQFSVLDHMNSFLAFLLTVFVVAPAIGYLLSRFVMKGLADAPPAVSIVVTVAVLVGCIGFERQVWDKKIAVSPPVPPLFPTHSIHVFSTVVTAQEYITILASILVAVLLYLLLGRTRIGTAMRAAVDNPELLKLFGGRPERVADLSWMIGMSLAALAGVLLVPVVGLDAYGLTLLVVNAFAAAIVGRLRSLPLTFVGAMALGLVDALAIGYIPGNYTVPGLGFPISSVIAVVPPLFLFVFAVISPQAQLRIGQVKGLKAANIPSLSRSVVWGGVGFVVLLLINGIESDANRLLVGFALVWALIMVSLVLLNGYGGHVSLAQLTFAGVGALVYARWDHPDIAGLVVAALVAALAGALVALPVIRLTGLYLALATLAFASLMETLVFDDTKRGFGGTGAALNVKKFTLGGHPIGSLTTYNRNSVIVLGVVFIAVSIGVLALRRGVVGRMLIAMRDSPAACGTLGLDQRLFRVGLFSGSAAIAGLAGALYASLRQQAGSSDFITFNNLPLLLLVVVMGVTTISGATLGGIGLMLLNNESSSKYAGLLFVILAVGAVLTARDPNGLVGYLYEYGGKLVEPLRKQLRESLPELPFRGGGPRGGSRDADEVPADDGYDVDYGLEEVPTHVAS